MMDFCNEYKIISRCRYHLFSQEDLSRIFKESNIEWVEDEDDANPDDMLNRSEFLEILMRIAVAKYGTKRGVNPFDPSHEESEGEGEHHISIAEGLNKMIEKAIITVYEKEDI